MSRLLALSLFLLAALTPGRSSAQLPEYVSSDARVFLVTVTQGDAVYSLFGHSALRVMDPDTGLDVAFNYGTFDFSASWFIPKFVYGILEYQLSVSSMRALVLGSEMEHRGVISHELALDSTEVNRLYAALVENYRPENATYRYDFFFDNCSTRIRDIVGRAAPVTWNADMTAGRSLRELLDPWTAHRPWLDTGIDLVLGAVTDRPATPREADFLPLLMDASFRSATVSGPDGERPLVARTDTLDWIPERASIPRGFPWPIIVGLALSTALLVLSVRRSTPFAVPGALDRALLSLLGTIGVVVTFLAFFSEHAAMARNFNVLWALPTHLVVAIAARRMSPRALGAYFAATAALGLVALTGPFIVPQQLPIALYPIVVVLVIRYGTMARRLLAASPGP